MIDLQSVLGTQAETFVESLQAVVSQLEVRQQHLLEELRNTSDTLKAIKQLVNGSRPELPAAIEVATLVPLKEDEITDLHIKQIEEEGAEESVEEEMETLEETDDVPPSIEDSEPATKRKGTRRQTSAKLGRRPKTKARKASKRTSAIKAAAPAEPSEDTNESAAESMDGGSSFNPRESVLKEFQGNTLRAAIKTILERNPGQSLSTDDVLQALYGKRISQENLQAARRLVVVELSKGKLAGIWTNVEGQRGHYRSHVA